MTIRNIFHLPRSQQTQQKGRRSLLLGKMTIRNTFYPLQSQQTQQQGEEESVAR
ncbi:hypothetical protein DPMN_179609 [Dreissena polymorpha]|uniref:Uncharacterized protein n=1 Tax=Dreissena polymorpha TaxID=45954 RepID=A0A9D4EEB5_DREPO|nr:hypothetical protein DPMN_179609 [Dreissena polymorpha]